MAESGNKKLTKLVMSIVVLALILIALLMLYQKKTQPPVDIKAEIPSGIKHVLSIYGPKAGDNFDKPESVAFDKDGNIYVADTGKNRIVVFNSNGNYIREFGDSKTTPYPLSIAVDDNSNKIYVTSLMAQLLSVLDNDGKVIKQVKFKDKQEIPLRVVLYKKKIYMTTVGKIIVLDLNGKVIKKWGSEGRLINQFEYPNGIVMGKFGDVKEGILISDSNNNRLQIFSIGGKAKAYLGRPPNSLKDRGLAFGLPTGAAIDEEGRVFVVDSLNHSIRILSNDGDDLGELGKEGSADGFYYYPTDIKHIKGNRFAITDKWNDRIQICELTIGTNPKPSTNE